MITKEKKNNLFLLWKTTNPPKLPLVIGVSLALVNTICSLSIPLLIKSQIENLNNGLNLEDFFLIFGLFVMELLSMAFSLYLLSMVGQKLVENLRSKLLGKLLNLKVDFYNKNNPGELISRVTNDTTVTMNVFSNDLAELLTSLLSIIGSLVILFILDVPMTLVILAVIPFFIFILIPFAKKIEKISYNQQENMANLTGFLSQILSEIRLIKSYNSEKFEYNQGSFKIKQLYNNGMKRAKIEAIYYPLLSSLLTIMILVIVGLGAYRVSEGYISAGGVVAYILYLFQILGPIGTFNKYITNVKTALGATERIFHILTEDDEEKLKFLFDETENKNLVSLHVKNVSFSYKESSVLNDISFHVAPKSLMAIVGPSGVGKSTLLYILERFYEPKNGEILLNGISHKEISLDRWRSFFSYVSQDSAMLATTIRNNITYGIEREVSEIEIQRVAKLSGCQNFIENLPNGYDTIVGERGINLSGGQKQRIAIARAFLNNAPILLLDEATASLDITSENIIKNALKELMHGKTTLVVTHRLNSIKDADQILLIDETGKSVIGKHEELILNNELYQKLCSELKTS